MKELTIEEKAKRYDEAIKVAKNNYETIMQMDKDCTFAKEGIVNTFHHMFPELKESEDKKIIKSFIRLLKAFHNVNFPTLEGFERKDMLAWLEKQGEQISLQTNERAWLYLVSDVLTWKDGIGQYLDDPRVQELAKKLCSKYAQKLYNPSVLSDSSNTEKDEQKPTDIIPKDFEKYVEHLLSLSDGEGHGRPAKVKEVSAELFKLAKLEQKPAWSEEDCNYIETIACHLDNIGNSAMAESLLNIMDKYKSLRPQNTWKPSDEQMEALEHFIVYHNGSTNYAKDLEELRLQLKKL